MAPEILAHAQKAQRAAENALVRMREAKSFPDFEEAWNDFLSTYGKVWTRLVAVCKANTKAATKWRGEQERIRKEDPLLRYLHHARNSDQHSVTDGIKHVPAQHSMQMPHGPGGVTVINHLSFSIINGVPEIHAYDGNAPIILGYTPARLTLLPVTDKGVRYDPPSEHRGKPLTKLDPIAVAEMGVKFSAVMLDELRELVTATS